MTGKGVWGCLRAKAVHVLCDICDVCCASGYLKCAADPTDPIIEAARDLISSILTETLGLKSGHCNSWYLKQ